MAEEGEGPRRRQIPGLPVRLHCKADPNFSLAVVPGQGPVMVPTDPRDDYQVSNFTHCVMFPFTTRFDR